MKAAAGGDSLSSKFDQLAAVGISGLIQVGKSEILKMVGLEDELPQRPLFKLVLVKEPRNS